MHPTQYISHIRQCQEHCHLSDRINEHFNARYCLFLVVIFQQVFPPQVVTSRFVIIVIFIFVFWSQRERVRKSEGKREPERARERED